MNVKHIFPVILIILDFSASIVYFVQGDIRLGIYWMAAGILTTSITV